MASKVLSIRGYLWEQGESIIKHDNLFLFPGQTGRQRHHGKREFYRAGWTPGIHTKTVLITSHVQSHSSIQGYVISFSKFVRCYADLYEPTMAYLFVFFWSSSVLYMVWHSLRNTTHGG